MFRSVSTVTRRPRLPLAGGFVLFLFAASSGTPAQAQTEPKLVLGVAVVAGDKADDKDKKAVEEATKYFKDDKEKEKQRADSKLPPDFPNPKAEATTGPSAADVAAALTLPPAGLGEQLLAGLALQREPPKPTPPRYRWAAITGERELRILGLKEKIAKGKYWNEAAEARKKGEIYLHSNPRRSWPIYSRADGNEVTFYVLVLEPGGDKVLTDEELSTVQRPGPEGITVFFSASKGKDRLKSLTTAYKDRYLILADSKGVIDILACDEVISNGRIRIGAGREREDVQRIYDRIVPLIPAGGE